MTATTEFPKASYLTDPYRNFKFRIKWDGKYVAGISKVSGLTRTTQVLPHRKGGEPSLERKTPGQTNYSPIILERGVIHDPAFEQWANKVWDYHNSTPNNQKGESHHKDASLKDFRKDIIVEIYNEADQKVLAYNVYRCWPSEFTALPELDSTENTIAIQSLTLQNEGWERDTSVKEPTEPEFTAPKS